MATDSLLLNNLSTLIGSDTLAKFVSYGVQMERESEVAGQPGLLKNYT